MKKDVLLTISGLQFDVHEGEEEHETIEMAASATYYEKDGEHYLFYEEAAEGIPRPIKNRIKLSPSRVEVRKSGPVSSEMIFIEKEKTDGLYETPYGPLHLGITSGAISFSVNETEITASISYDLEINSELVSTNKIVIRVVPKGTACSLFS